MRVLILGATGFTGSVLIDHILQYENAVVTAIVHSKPANKRDNVRYIDSSLQQISTGFLEASAFDYIFHLARISGKNYGNIGRYIAGMRGARANKRLINNINNLKKTPRLIYLSGSLMYGHQANHDFIETDKLNPTGFAKYYYQAEKPILEAMNAGMDIILLRAPWIIGNGSWFKQLYTNHITAHGTVPVYGNTKRRMSLLTVEDCAGMLWHYAVLARKSGCYNIFTGDPINYNDFIDTVAKAYNCDNRKQYSTTELVNLTDKTTAASVLCDVALGTIHHDLKDSYQTIHYDINKYLTQLTDYGRN